MKSLFPGASPPRIRSDAGHVRARRAVSSLQCCVLALCFAGCETSLATRSSDADAGADGAMVPGDAARADATGSLPRDAALVDAVSDAATPVATCECFDGPGDYCEADVAARAHADACAALGAADGGHRLLSCSGGAWTVSATCASGCEGGETGASASCSLPICDCFVRSAWCGASAARHGLGLDPPCRVPLVPEHDFDILGCDGPRWVVQTECAHGCFEAPTGTADACIPSPVTPSDPGWPACPHHGLLHSGLHPEASDRLRCAGVSADRISQTVGYATASAGYHAPDGTSGGLDYTAAVDLRTRDLTTSEIRALLARLGENGFAAWYRQPGSDGWPSSEAPHIHAVFAGVVMKSALRGQVRDYFDGLNGLASHTRYRFWSPAPATLDIVRVLFRRHYTP